MLHACTVPAKLPLTAACVVCPMQVGVPGAAGLPGPLQQHPCGTHPRIVSGAEGRMLPGDTHHNSRGFSTMCAARPPKPCMPIPTRTQVEQHAAHGVLQPHRQQHHRSGVGVKSTAVFDAVSLYWLRVGQEPPSLQALPRLLVLPCAWFLMLDPLQAPFPLASTTCSFLRPCSSPTTWRCAGA